MPIKLKPCPFCGETDIAIRERYYTPIIGGPYFSYGTKCNFCGVLLPCDWETQEGAIEAWNTRKEDREHA